MQTDAVRAALTAGPAVTAVPVVIAEAAVLAGYVLYR